MVEPKKAEAKAEKKAPVKKETASTAKKAPVKATEITFYLQFGGREVSKAQLEERLKEVWTKDLGRKIAELKSVAYYVKPEEATAYFVVNDEVEGSFAI